MYVLCRYIRNIIRITFTEKDRVIHTALFSLMRFQRSGCAWRFLSGCIVVVVPPIPNATMSWHCMVDIENFCTTSDQQHLRSLTDLTSFPTVCRFACFLNVFSVGRWVVRRHRAAVWHKNCTGTLYKRHIQHIRSSSESVQRPKSKPRFPRLVFCWHSRYPLRSPNMNP